MTTQNTIQVINPSTDPWDTSDLTAIRGAWQPSEQTTHQFEDADL